MIYNVSKESVSTMSQRELATLLETHGWTVTYHNDLNLDGRPITLTVTITHLHGGEITEEGHTNEIALRACALKAFSLTEGET